MKRRNVSPMLFTVIAFSAISVLIAAAPKEGQKEKNARTGESAAKSSGQQADWQITDQMLASCVAIDNQAEIEMAQFALKHTKNEDVRKFAQALITDHQNFLKQLREFAPEAAQEGYLKLAANEAKQPRRAGETPDKGQAKPNITTRVAAKPPIKDGQPGTVGPMELMRELASTCVNDTQEWLAEKEADKFDECFIGTQIALHGGMRSKLKVYQRHASDELADVFSKGHETTKTHFEKAEKLMEQLAKSNQRTAAN